MKIKFLAIFTLLLIVSTGAIFAQNTYKVDASTSNLEWTGKKVTGQHNGNLNIKSGSLSSDDGILTGGKLSLLT